MGSIKGQKHNPYIEGKYAHLNPNDVVFTPDWLAKQICGMFDIDGKVLEPCKGEGAFLKYLPENTDWCEIAEGRNYYDYNEKVDWIVTNPPYSDYNRFLEHSFALADNIVALAGNVRGLCVRWGFPALNPNSSTNFKLSTND